MAAVAVAVVDETTSAATHDVEDEGILSGSMVDFYMYICD